MENNKIMNDGSQPEVEKNLGEADLTNNEGIIQIINSLRQKLLAKEKLFHILHSLLIILIPIIVVFSIFIFILYLVPVLQEMMPGQKTEITNDKELKKSASYKKQISLMKADIQRLSRKYNSYTSGQSYIVINTTGNRFFLYRNKILLREGFCSTGSLMMLKTEKGKVWVFKTPRGKRWIQGKITNPSWKRPDWSFIEEGSPVPAKDDPSRWESGVLGDYALGIGDGYLIHGTIYKRFLGMPVTHGCVRLNDEDLEVVYNNLNIGSKVYIF
ncbi:MAG: L,D-transpeptidase [Bacteroidia bacterium]|nr:L,D-transpeptidase [Bacteroidia bacterium]